MYAMRLTARLMTLRKSEYGPLNKLILMATGCCGQVFIFGWKGILTLFFFPCLCSFLSLCIKFDLMYNKKSMLRWAKPFLIYVVPLLQNYLYHVNNNFIAYTLTTGCKTLSLVDRCNPTKNRYISPQSMYSLHHRLSKSLK